MSAGMWIISLGAAISVLGVLVVFGQRHHEEEEQVRHHFYVYDKENNEIISQGWRLAPHDWKPTVDDLFFFGRPEAEQ